MAFDIISDSGEFAIGIILTISAVVLIAIMVFPDVAETAPISSGIVAEAFKTRVEAMNFASSGSEFVNLFSTFRIELEPEDDNSDSKRQNEYRLTVVQLNDDGSEFGEKIEKKGKDVVTSNIAGCNSRKCTFTCKMIFLKKETDDSPITVSCTETSYSGGNSDGYYCPCPYDDPIIFERNEVPKLIKEYSQRIGVDESLIKAIIRKESGWVHCTRPKSGQQSIVTGGIKGSKGIMQINPNVWGDKFGDPCKLENNIRAGVSILKINMDFFKGKGYSKVYKELGIAYYNCGGVWKNSKGVGVIVDYEKSGGNPANLEWNNDLENKIKKYCTSAVDNTANYVKKVLEYEAKYKVHPDCYSAICN